MSSNLAQYFRFTVGGQPVDFASPFAVPTLELEAPPARYTVQIAASATTELWDGEIPTGFDILAIYSDQSLDIECSVNSGASLFTLFCRAGGYPVVLQGSDSYVSGALAGTLGDITGVRAKNRNTLTAANVTVLIGKLAA